VRSHHHQLLAFLRKHQSKLSTEIAKFLAIFWAKFAPHPLLPLITACLPALPVGGFQPMLPPTPRQAVEFGAEISAPDWVADFYMGPSNDAARLSVPPTCPVGQSTASLPRRGFAPAQTSATSRITRFSWQQPHVRLIAIATSAAWHTSPQPDAALSHRVRTNTVQKHIYKLPWFRGRSCAQMVRMLIAPCTRKVCFPAGKSGRQQSTVATD